jgi:hypothetical protein
MSVGLLIWAFLLLTGRPIEPAEAASACSMTRKVAQAATVEQINADPAAWDCKRVKVRGIATRAVENYYLYATPDDRCHVGDRHLSIAVDWDSSRVREQRFARVAELEGVFRHQYTKPAPPGYIRVSGWGPGPLTKVRVIRWLSAELPACDRH